MSYECSFQAQASVDCEIKTVSNGKTSESKIELKALQGKPGQFETEKDGLIFQAEVVENPEYLYRISVTDKKSNQRSVSRYGGLKPNANDLPNMNFSTALVLGEGEKERVGQLNCHLLNK
jgi:hypothetical protein